MKPATPYDAKKIIKAALDERRLAYTKLTAKTIGFADLARGSAIFVTIWGWKPNPLYQELRVIARANDFLIEVKS